MPAEYARALLPHLQQSISCANISGNTPGIISKITQAPV
jgi:hypothetical protein